MGFAPRSTHPTAMLSSPVADRGAGHLLVVEGCQADKPSVVGDAADKPRAVAGDVAFVDPPPGAAGGTHREGGFAALVDPGADIEGARRIKGKTGDRRKEAAVRLYPDMSEGVSTAEIGAAFLRRGRSPLPVSCRPRFDARNSAAGQHDAITSDS